MKKMRKNNKGFSLVELIVVVLIMAIIAVALAPQIMKWVGHSRTSTDAQTYDTLVENINLALADEEVLAEVKNIGAGSKITFTIASDGTTLATNPTGKTITKLTAKMTEICGTNWTSTVKKKDSAAKDASGNAITSYVVSINDSATIERTTPPNSAGVK